jgi:DNA-binding transcriptional ArsR family regulator
MALDPTRASILDELSAAPASAAGLAPKLRLGRQKIGYHLGLLESHGLVVESDRRQHGGIVERVFAPVAAGFVVSPAAFGRGGAAPDRVADRLSASYAIALAARVVREVGRMVVQAQRSSKRLPTLSIDTEIRFRSAADRAAFADDTSDAIRALAARYHDPDSPGGRWYRLAVVAHPRPIEEGGR